MKKIDLHRFFPPKYDLVLFWRSGTRNALKVITQSKIQSDDSKNTVLHFWPTTKGKELKYCQHIA